MSKEVELKVTLQQLGRMRKILADLESGKGSEYSHAWFEVLAEGPREEIRRLEATLASLRGHVEPSRDSMLIFVRDFFDGLWVAISFVVSVVLRSLAKGIVCVLLPIPALITVELTCLGARKSGRPEPVPFWRREGEWSAVFSVFFGLWLFTLIGFGIAAALR